MAKKIITRPRSAVSGRFVKPWYADKYPHITIIDRMKVETKSK